MVDVSVVVVTFNSVEVLPACLNSLEAGLTGVSHELIVVDNASRDGSAELARAIAPRATVLALKNNAGYAAGFNAALGVAKPYRAALLLNPDVRLSAGAVRFLLDGLESAGTGITAPRILSGTGELEPSLRREPTVWRALGEAVLGGRRAGRIPALGEMVTLPSEYARGRTADWATGAVLLISRGCIDATGAPVGGRGRPWDESFFLYSEESEFCLRARDAGFSLRYVPEAEVVHLGGESCTSPALWSRLTQNRVVLYRRRHGPYRTVLFWLAVVLNEAVRAPASATHASALRALLGMKGQARGNEASPSDPAQPGYVCFSAQDWWYHNRAHSDFQLLRGVAASRTVLLINSIAMRMPLPGRSPQFLRRIARKASSMAKRLCQPLPDLPGYWVLSPFIVPLYGMAWTRSANAWLVRLQVKLATRRLGISEPVCIVTVPTAWEVARSMPRRALVYNRSDKHSAFGEVNQRYIQDLEGNLLRSADRVLYVSRTLMAEEAGVTGTRSYFIDHGVDLDHFRPRPAAGEAAAMAHIPRPRVGFFGGLDDYTVDFTLLDQLARDLPHAQIVLVGDATCSMAELTRHDNVHWLGFQDYAHIPAFGSGFDVAIMPWLRNDWIRHSNPIKLKEYLALGLAVVSTDCPEIRPYDHLVRVADSASEFIDLVRRTLDDGGLGTADERRAAVADASWERRAAQLIDLCEGRIGSG